MARKGRKRSHDDYRADANVGVGVTVAELRRSSNEEQESRRPDDEDNGGEWQQVESSRSKRKKKHDQQEHSNYPSITHSSHHRLQSFVKLGDLQSLILYLLADGTSPQWCAVKHHGNVRKVVALMVPGLEAAMFDGTIRLLPPCEQQSPNVNGAVTTDSSKLVQPEQNPDNSQDTPEALSSQPKRTLRISPDDYYPTRLITDRLPEPLQPLSDIFAHVWPVKAPGDDRYAKMHSPMASMLIAPLVKSKEEKKAKGPQPPQEGKNWKNQRTPITELVATTEELIEEDYVLHPACFAKTASADSEMAKREINHQTASDGWVDTPDIPDLASGNVPDSDIEQGAILAGRKVLTMDCEMCITSPLGVTPQVFSLTRISIIDWDGKVVMDDYVRPAQPITDYLTPYSGITAEKLVGVTTTLQDIQKRLVNDILTPQTILVGHSLNSDLNALQLTHPYIIDTALLFPHPRGPPLKSSLKWLAQKYLSREIQKGHGKTGHDSVEDARACLDLVKQKCEKGKLWGTSEASGESIFKRLARSKRHNRDKLHVSGDDEYRTGAVVDWGDPSRGYGASAKLTIGCENDAQVVAGIKKALLEPDDMTEAPKRGVDFVFARMRELEAHRGWWNRSKTIDNQSLLDNATTSTSAVSVGDVAAQTVSRIQDVWNCLPPCTAFVVFTGSGDPQELSEMQAMQQRFKQEYQVKKWDDLSVKWTDAEEQKLRRACAKARQGLGFVAVK